MKYSMVKQIVIQYYLTLVITHLDIPLLLAWLNLVQT